MLKEAISSCLLFVASRGGISGTRNHLYPPSYRCASLQITNSRRSPLIKGGTHSLAIYITKSLIP